MLSLNSGTKSTTLKQNVSSFSPLLESLFFLYFFFAFCFLTTNPEDTCFPVWNEDCSFIVDGFELPEDDDDRREEEITIEVFSDFNQDKPLLGKFLFIFDEKLKLPNTHTFFQVHLFSLFPVFLMRKSIESLFHFSQVFFTFFEQKKPDLIF